MLDIMSYILARLSESSTWATMLASLSVQLHLHMNPDVNTWLVQGGVWLATGIGIFLKEGWQVPNEKK